MVLVRSVENICCFIHGLIHIMGSTTILLALFAVAFVVIESEAAGTCPLPSKVYNCSPKCVQNYDCTHGKMCCRNSCNAMSCVETTGNSGASGGDKYSQSGGAGSYCNNETCNSFEVCKMDPITKRMKCQRK